jgi:hypothetical protein
MSAWRLAVRELYERGPTSLQQLELRQLTSGALVQGMGLGLIKGPGRSGRPGSLYALTEAGHALAQGRMQCVIKRAGHLGINGGRARGTVRVLRPTWLASLPPANAIRLQGAP